VVILTAALGFLHNFCNNHLATLTMIVVSNPYLPTENVGYVPLTNTATLYVLNKVTKLSSISPFIIHHTQRCS
jgi:hypothetical protein